MDNFKQATKEGLRFATSKGSLTTEQLWDLSITDLDALAVALETEYASTGKKSFVTTKSVKDKALKLKFDVVLEVLTTKVEEAETAKTAKEAKEYNKKILAIMAEKQEDNLKSKSLKDLEKMLKPEA